MSPVCLHRKVFKKFRKKTLFVSHLKFFSLYVKEKKTYLLGCNFDFRPHISLMTKSFKAPKSQAKLVDFQDKSLLIVDDDDPLRNRLSRAMEKKGFAVKEAKTVADGVELVKKQPPQFAVIDLRLEDGNGLDVVKILSKTRSESRIVMLTGYGNLPTAVAAVKAGAIDYIAKPVDADNVEAALLAAPDSKANPPENPMSADRVKWEHIHRVFELCNRNVSETARRLKMHRRTLQRILSKRSPR